MVDSARNVPTPHQQLSFQTDGDGMMGTENMFRRVIDEPVDQSFGIGPIAAPKEDGNDEDEREAEAQRLFKTLRFGDRVSRGIDGAVRPADLPKRSRERDQSENSIVKSKQQNTGL